jgi:hypothetical protein
MARRPTADPKLVISALTERNPIFTRAHTPGTPLHRAQMAHLNAFAVGQEWYGKREKLAQDGRLTPRGITEKLLAEGKDKALKPLRKLTHELGRLRESVAERRARMVLRSEPKDTAGAIERMELRNFLRGLSFSEVMELAQAEPRIAEAIVTMPPALSGLPPDLHKILYDKALEEEFGEEIAAVQELEGALDFAEVTLKLANDAVAESLGDEMEVEDLVKSVHAEVDTQEKFISDRERLGREQERKISEHTNKIDGAIALVTSLPFKDRSKVVDAALDMSWDDVKHNRT